MIRIVAGVWLALTWVVLSAHCQLEAIPGLDFLPCASDVHQSGPDDDPCGEAGCCSIESARYHPPRQQDFSPLDLVTVVPLETFGVVDRTLPKEVSLGVLTAAPPDWQAPWQFTFRAALPPRAPSLLSS